MKCCVVYTVVMEENLIMWKDGHHILLCERSWLQLGSDFGKLTKICIKILDDVYIKMFTYSLGNGIKGFLFIYVF